MITHWQMEESIRKRNLIPYTQQEKEKRERMLERSTSIVDDGNDEICVRRACVYPLTTIEKPLRQISFFLDDERDHSSE